jgi:hypothetical protein
MFSAAAHAPQARALMLASVALLGVFTTAAREAYAGGPLGEQGSRLETSAYGVDLFQGPVLGSSRITGLAGAFTAIAEGADAIQWNPAAVSLRAPYSTTRDDFELTGGVTLPSSVKRTDFDNNGSVGFTYDSFVWLTAGGYVQHDQLGLGVLASFQNYELGVPGGGVVLPDTGEFIKTVIVRLLRIDPVIAYGLLDEQLHVGFGLRFAAFYGVGSTGAETDDERLLLNSNSIGAQGGALFTPRQLPLRLGVALRSPVGRMGGDPGRIAPDAEGDRVIGDIYLPGRLELPWEIEAGVAVQLWRRPFNLAWTNEDRVDPAESEPHRRTVNGVQEPPWRGARRLLRARYAAIPRERVLLSLSALVSGPVKNAVGLESMLSQTVERSGERTVVTVRAGVESEIIPWWLVVRGGSYYEPSRFRDGEARLHGTGGFDVRVLRSTIFGLWPDDTLFRLSGAVDVARDYFGWSLGAGVFH